MAKETKARYSDEELEDFRKLIEDKINKAQADLELLRSAYMNDGNNGTDDTSPTFKAFEEGSETMSKEANTQLAIRQEKFIRDLKNAMIRIENNSAYILLETLGENIDFPAQIYNGTEVVFGNIKTKITIKKIENG